MKLITIAAISSPHGIIGYNNQLPWRLKEDLRRFRKHTIGYAVVMGRSTYESIGHPLINRLTIVLSSRDEVLGHTTAKNLSQAVRIADEEGYSTCFFVGGAKVYEEALPWSSEALITRVHAPNLTEGVRFQGDFFDMKLVSSEDFPKDRDNDYDMTFQRWVR